MTFFPDVNVWLALVVAEHTHAHQARKWAEQATSDWIVLNRITQMGLLRLLTNASVMGKDALTGAESWRIADGLLEHENIRFVKEPDNIELTWRNLTPAGRVGQLLDGCIPRCLCPHHRLYAGDIRPCLLEAPRHSREDSDPLI